MEKKEYESIEAAADKLQSEAERDFSRKVLIEQGYKNGYVQGVEDLLKAIRRSEKMDAVRYLKEFMREREENE